MSNTNPRPTDTPKEFETSLKTAWRRAFNQTPMFVESERLPRRFVLTTSKAIYFPLDTPQTASSEGIAYLPVTIDCYPRPTTCFVRVRLPVIAHPSSSLKRLLETLEILLAVAGVGVHNWNLKIPTPGDPIAETFKTITANILSFYEHFELEVYDLLKEGADDLSPAESSCL